MSTTGTAAPTDSMAPILDEDPFSPALLEDPHPFHERLREIGPIAFLPKYGVHAIGRYDAVREALANWQGLRSGAGVGLEEPWRARGLLQTDPPEHDAPREVLGAIMSARVLRAMSDECSRQARALLDGLLAGHSGGDNVDLDAHGKIAAVFPVNFFPDASGINDEGRENMLPYADHIFNFVGPRNQLRIDGEADLHELTEWAAKSCERDILKPKGFGADIWAAVDRGDLLEEQAPNLVLTLLNAGVDTTVYGLSALLCALATNPDQWAALRDNPDLARVAFDEALRWESPVQHLFRKSTTDVTIGGVTIPEGTRVLICYGAANRDPRRWDNPDDYDLSRDPSGHLAFGMGIHQCVGQHAARLQSESLLRVLVERVETIELIGPVQRHHNNALRGWGEIPIRFKLA